MPGTGKRNRGEQDDLFDFDGLASMKQVSPTKAAGNKIDVEVTQAASQRVLVVSCRKTKIKMGVEASFTHRLFNGVASGELSLLEGTKLIG